ncbi:MAG: hypothetical protein ACI8PZ_003085, partial [Myxococcota bacterium]
MSTTRPERPDSIGRWGCDDLLGPRRGCTWKLDNRAHI